MLFVFFFVYDMGCVVMQNLLQYLCRFTEIMYSIYRILMWNVLLLVFFLLFLLIYFFLSTNNANVSTSYQQVLTRVFHLHFVLYIFFVCVFYKKNNYTTHKMMSKRMLCYINIFFLYFVIRNAMLVEKLPVDTCFLCKVTFRN